MNLRNAVTQENIQELADQAIKYRKEREPISLFKKFGTTQDNNKNQGIRVNIAGVGNCTYTGD